MPYSIRVLYVDDESDLLEVGKLFLEENQEFSVTTIVSPKAALDLLQKEHFDAIVSDYQMDELDGIRFLQAVREQFPIIPFILFTGRGREEVVIQALNSGADFYLQKGGDPDAQFAELAHKIRQAVRTKQAEQSLAENRDYLERIYTSVQGGILIIDAKTHEILDLNPAAEKMMGKAKDQIIGRICHEFICPAEQGRCPITDLHQEVDNSERILLTGDGGKRDIIKYVVPFNLHGRECLLETFLDNTERKQAADNLKEAYERLTVAEEELRQNYEALSKKELALRDREKQLAETNTYLSNLISYAANPIVIWDVNSRITGFNKAFEKLTGFVESNVTGRDFDVLFPDESRKSSLDLVCRALFGEKWEGVEIPVKTIHGATRTVLWNSANIYAEDGVTPVATIAMGTDITERKKAEMELLQSNTELHNAYEQIAQTEEELRQNYEQLSATEEELRQNYETLAHQERALRESEEKFRVLVESSLDGIVITDFSGILLFANAAAGSIVEAADYPSLIGKKNILEFIAPAFRPAVLRDFAQVLEGHDAYLVTYQLITGKGREVWAECIGRRITFGETPAMLVSFRDVTDRKRAEEVLRESEKKFVTVFWSNPVPLTLTSADGGVFADVNEAFLGSTGYTRDEVIGKNPGQLGLFVNPDDITRLVTELRTKHQVSGMDLPCRTKNGEIRICRFSSRVIMMGSTPHVISTVEDVSERMKTEEALQQANKKLHLLSSITRHDIKNQLMTLDGYVSLMDKKSPAGCEQEIARIRKVSRQISHMIQFTKDYQQVGIASPVWTDLRALVDDAEKGISQMAVTIRNDIPAGAEVYADPLIAKVFFNLVDNAVRHGGAVTSIRFSLVPRNGDCMIVCEDNGTGIAPEMKKKLFRKGFGKNNGFGLFLSREVLDITGITIQETGEPGKGARFEMNVPKESFRMAAGK
jgi:PAS domain S-box-containing protein